MRTMTAISAVVFLYKPASIVAAVAVIDLIDSGFISEGAAMSTLIFASVLAVRLLTLRLMHAEKTLCFLVATVFLGLLPIDAHAYLDPGTGSMLLSVVMGLVSTGYFVIRRLPSMIARSFSV